MNPSAYRRVEGLEPELHAQGLHDALNYRRPDGSSRMAEHCKMHAVLRTGRTMRAEDDTFVTRDGRDLPIAYTASPVIRDEQVIGAVVAFRDVSERKAYEDQLTHQAFHDTLTGLPN